MATAFRTPSDLLADKYRAGVSDYAQRADTHTETAREIHAQHTTRVPGELSYMTKWENPQDLRLWAHEQELAQECLTLSNKCRWHWWVASNKAHQHTLYCQVRTQSARLPHTPAVSLAQVASDHACLTRLRETHAPPVRTRVPALATCHASNAPGLSFHAYERMEIAPT